MPNKNGAWDRVILKHRKSHEGSGPESPLSNCSLCAREQFDFGIELEIAEDDDEDGIRRIANINDVECDGIAHENAGDPPGNSTTYILSGEYWREDYRLATFASFPVGSGVYPADLASSGFCYTGCKDRVRCYSCGITVDNWVIGDDGRDPKWHKRDCPLMNGRDDTNIPREAFNFRAVFGQLKSTMNTMQQTASSCAGQMTSQHQWHQQNPQMVGSSASIPVADNLLAGAAQGQYQELEFEELRLGEINSEQHELLIFSLDLRKEEHRRMTFEKWPSYPAPELPAKLAEEGFFYLGNLDRAQCFSCSGILRNWTRNDEPRREHKKHFPNCKIVRGLETRNMPMTAMDRQRVEFEEKLRLSSANSAKEPADPTPEEQRHYERQFQCLQPLNPRMQNLEDRIASFTANWPAGRIKATIRSIAEAGFYYLGQEDRTKCFYCNGGLQNWDEDDEPWTEHAKWFPGCEYVLRRKGPGLVKRLLEEHPNIQRPTIRNHCAFDISPPPVNEHRNLFNEPANPVPAYEKRNERGPAESLRNLQSVRSCKNCSSWEADQLCLPCGHISLCSNCTAVTKCPACGIKIQSKRKIFRN